MYNVLHLLFSLGYCHAFFHCHFAACISDDGSILDNLIMALLEKSSLVSYLVRDVSHV